MATELKFIDAPTGSTIVAVVRRESDEFVWSVSGADFVPFDIVDIADYAVPLVETPLGSRYFVGSVPSDVFMAVIYYLQAGPVLVVDDTILGGEDLNEPGVGGPVYAPPAGTLIYASVDDMKRTWSEKLLTELTNFGTNPTVPIDDRIGEALVAVQAEFHRRVGIVYQTPLAGLSAEDQVLVRDVILRRALAWLYDHRPGKHLDKNGKPYNPATEQTAFFNRMCLIFLNTSSFTATRRNVTGTGILVV